MRAYNIEFFNPQTFELIYHTNLQDIEYAEDYINPTTADITINLSDASLLSTGDYVRISRGDLEIFGLVEEVSSKSKCQTQIKYGSFLNTFDKDILFNTDKQGTGAFEEVMAQMIDEIWINSATFNGSDAFENIKGLSVHTTSRTLSWTLGLETSSEQTHFCKVNSFLDTFVSGAMSKYNVSFRVEVNPTAKTIDIYIGKVASGTKTIEADLPNILSKDITIAQNFNEVNKLLVYDASSFEPLNNPAIYYLHSDDSYDRKNEDRIYPIIRRCELVNPSGDQTFEELAEEKAKEVLGGIERNNYIELEINRDDTLIQPDLLEYGQEVNIISNGTKYVSVFTGREIDGDTETLIFGTLRLNLTSKI